MAQQSSRLDRLLTLLDTGSTQATRYTAARQIGEIAKSHALELNSLLKKVSQYLRSRNWDTRVAAAHAIGAIAENVRHTTLKELFSCIEAEVLENGLLNAAEEIASVWSDFHPDDLGVLSFSRLDINRVLEFGNLLLSSGGQEYDVVDNNKNPTERLARQKLNLRRRLGLDVCGQFVDINDMIKDEDLILSKCSQENGFNHGSVHSQNVRQLVANMVPSFRPKRLSRRELNLLKRKAKLNAKDQSKGWSEDEEITSRNNKKETMSENSFSKQVVADASVEDNCESNDDGGWPFGHFVEQLIHDIFDPVWEIRHGAVMALREILSRQGACAGVSLPDVNLESVWPEANIEHADSAKRPREIDLNDNLTVDEAELDFKRRKYLNDQVMPEHSAQLNGPSVYSEHIVDGKKLAPSASMVMEGMHSVTLRGSLDQGTSDVTLESDIAVKSEAYLENAVLNDKTESALQTGGSDLEQVLCNSVSTSSSCENGGPSKMSILASIPENSKLRRLIYVARRSWVRNWEILQDCAIRFLCVLSLDRFGDFVSDQVVAPVRETSSQALGAVLKNMHPSLVRETLNVLLHMQRRQEWEVRHGSLLGIKYLVAVRQDLLKDLLVFILPACKAGLDDADDDVRAVAAEALIPAASSLASYNSESLNSVVMLLWDILLDLDDLSPSTSSVMNLLAEIYSQPEIVTKMLASLTPAELQEFDFDQVSQCDGLGKQIKAEENPYILSILTPRLWPFMRHSIASVRHSAIRTMERLLDICYKRFSPAEVSALWSKSTLGDTLRIVFQNLLLESVKEILRCSERVWRLLVQCPTQDLECTAVAYFSSWLQLATTPSGVAFDVSKMLCPAVLPRKSHVKAAAKMRAVKLENDSQMNHPVNLPRETALLDSREDCSSNNSRIVVGSDNEKSVTCMRVVTATALGIFAAKLPDASLPVVIDALWSNLTSLYGFRRQVAAVLIISWFKEIRCDNISGRIEVSRLLGPIRKWLLELLACSDPSYPTKNSNLPYAELSRTYKKMRNESTSLYHLAESSGVFKNYVANANVNMESLSIDDAINFASKLSYPSDCLNDISSSERHVVDEIEASKQQLLSTASYLTCLQNNLHIAVSSLLAAAVVWMSDLPERLNPIVLPLMAAIKREKEEILQEMAAEGLAELVCNCVGRKPSPNDKIIKNICSLTCMDPSVTPVASVVTSIDIIEDHDLLSLGVSTNQKLKNQVPDSVESRSKLEGSISRRGAELALKHLCQNFGPSLFEKLSKLWDCLTEVIRPLKFEDQCATDDQQLMLMIDNNNNAQSLINNLHVVRSVASMVDKSLEAKILTLLPCIICCVRHCHVAVRLAASRCIASMAKTMMGGVMKSVIEKVIPMLQDSSSVHARQGAGMLFCLLVQVLGGELVPYAPILVVPLLRCMSDSDKTVRQTVTRSFAVLVPLLPLARGAKIPIELSEASSSNREDVEFLEQLLDNSHIDDYKLPIKLKVELRRYQHEGINWLSFLRRFKLHGILCDDMGLGKTLQASAIVASDIAERHGTNSGHALSIIICPSTLVGHWAYEIEKYIDDSLVSTFQYVGSIQDRALLRKSFGNYDVIITSYDVVRKDIDFLGKIVWNYCVLDEGHIIKNSKSKITTAVKQLQAEHRLILSGTPIQNNVLELWSLFDFLMPGFLGTERQFQATYGKPLLAAKDSKCSSKDAEAGVLAMEALHKQVMPFLLRRTKDEVLSDLPEKIIQDRYCDLSSIQLKLYEQFSSSGAKKEVSDIVRVTEGAKATEAVSPATGTSHVFQALKYLLKLCSHPLLVLGQNPPASLMEHLIEALPGSSDVLKELHELQHSPKLVALQEILEECGIGLNAPGSESAVAVGQHRVLIFAQHRALLDIIERDLFQAHMKSVTYLRLDGSVEPERRFELVKSFNSDPTVDVLLLTTHVGGLGLNLTSADTLVFMEHDWNPMKDLQAMDRAHRLGQRKVVNVHRLIMRGTLEEKVMSLQRFKVSVANAVINAENASLKTMNTDQLLDLFTPAQTTRKSLSSSIISGEGSAAEAPQATSKKGLKAMLSGLEDLWDQSQYAEEYNLSQFLAKLDG